MPIPPFGAVPPKKGGGTGTVTSVSVVSTNGFAGTVANASTTPALTLKTTITGLLKGNGTAISAATAGTDYLAGPLTGDVTTSGEAATVVGINGTSLAGLATGILKNTTGTGVPTIAASGTDYLTPSGNGSSLTGITAAQVGALALTGGTMSGVIAMGSNKITGLTNGSSAQDAAAFGQIPVLPLTTKGDLFGFDTANNRIPVGADTFVLTADSTQTLGLKWAAPSAGSGADVDWQSRMYS